MIRSWTTIICITMKSIATCGVFLPTRYESRPFVLLDLGCGSARHLARALQGRSVSRYVGYDLSDVALAHAGRNLTGIGLPGRLAPG